MNRTKVKDFVFPVLVFFSFFLFSLMFAILLPSNVILSSALSDVCVLVLSGCLYWCYVRSNDTEKFRFNGISILLMVFLFVVLWFFTQAAAACVSLHVVDNNMGHYREVQQSDVLGYLLLSVFVAPVSEEFVFRGVIYGMFRKHMPVFVAALISSVLFAVSHGTWTHLPVAVIVGLTACLLFEVTGYLRYSILFHFLYNGCSIGFVIPVPDSSLVVSVPFVVLTNVALFFCLTFCFWKRKELRAFVIDKVVLEHNLKKANSVATDDINTFVSTDTSEENGSVTTISDVSKLP